MGSALAASVCQQLAQDQYSDPAAVIGKFSAEKEEGSRLFREKKPQDAVTCWLDACIDIDKLVESSSWPKLVRRGGVEFVSQLAPVYFLMQLNVAHVRVSTMSCFVAEQTAESALNFAVRSIGKKYWTKGYKYLPSVTHLAKLRYRYAIFYRLQGNPENAQRALGYINAALELQPGDAAIMKEKGNILDWMACI